LKLLPFVTGGIRNMNLINLQTMEDLFSTNIAVNNENVNYRVIFDNEKYVFLSEADNKAFPTFSFRREHDEWLDQELLPPDIKNQAIDALDRYLLKQH
jgi:hypothetical protein